MSTTRVSVGFVPLLDCAPLVVTHELGFDLEEGIAVDLKRVTTWSLLRDQLVHGKLDAAQMLSPAPIAMALDLGGVRAPLTVPMVLSLNGNILGVSAEMGARLMAEGHSFRVADAAQAGRALRAVAPDVLRVGVPFPFSMHRELLEYWLRASGFDLSTEVEVKSIPPSMMPEALRIQEIDVFCVGEPWGSLAVEQGAGMLLLPGRAIWTAAPEKVLALHSSWVVEEPELTRRLMRAVWKAGRWLAGASAKTTVAEILSRPAYLDLPSELLDRALQGKFITSPQGDRQCGAGFVEFFDGAASFPWRSQAAWIADRLADRYGLDRAQAVTQASKVFRPDLYRDTLRDLGAVLPGASSKIEGGIAPGLHAPTETGDFLVHENTFFDGSVFDPNLRS